MSDKILLLPEHVANQIAAGEVVQRPSSVVKELIENAVDAKASSIQVFIVDAGKHLIQIKDNGSGMSQTDARMAFERHATSKIKNTEDIFAIMTRGFRGEALASIAAVAQVELQTNEGEDIGNSLKIEGGNFIGQDTGVFDKGTSISVKNLFFNVPARRNFLKSNSIEFKHIHQEFTRIALAHPEIRFELYNEEKEVHILPDCTRKQRILQLFGKKLDEKLLPISENTDTVVIDGYVLRPEFCRKSKNEQFFFVNDRFIKSPYLHHALKTAYEKLISPDVNPSYFLYITIDPRKIDINIHPTKTEIKFEDDAIIYKILLSAIKQSLGKFQVVESLDFNTKLEIPVQSNYKAPAKPTIKVDRNFNPFNQKSLTQNTWLNSSSEKIDDKTKWNEILENQDVEIGETIKRQEEELFQTKEIENWNLIQIGAKYISYTESEVILFFDQYRLHKMILYRKYLADYNKTAIVSQQLLIPFEMEINALEQQILTNHELDLLEMGFDFETSETVKCTSIPMGLEPSKALKIILDILNDLNQIDSNEQDIRLILAKNMAKNAAIRGGNQLNTEQMHSMIKEWKLLEQPQYDPEGKKIVQILNVKQIGELLQ